MIELQSFTMHLAFVNADDRQPDPATVGEEARQSITALREQGYTVQPAYTGAKGGDVFTIAAQIGQSIVDNKELLISLISVATPILTFLLNRHEKRLDKDDRSVMSQQQEQSIDIYISINQAIVQVDTATWMITSACFASSLRYSPILSIPLRQRPDPRLRYGCHGSSSTAGGDACWGGGSHVHRQR